MIQMLWISKTIELTLAEMVILFVGLWVIVIVFFYIGIHLGRKDRKIDQQELEFETVIRLSAEIKAMEAELHGKREALKTLVNLKSLNDGK